MARTGDSEIQKIARERIRILFRRAAEAFPDDPVLADRYVRIARKMAMRHRVRIPRALRRRFCRRCESYLVPGINARVRVHRGKVVVTCRVCGHHMRYPLGRTDGSKRTA